MAGLEQLCSVLIAEFDLNGGLLHGNAGLYRVTAAKSATLWELFSQPHVETLLTTVPDCDERIHSGLMTARGPGDTMVGLTGSIYRDADRILVVAGYDMNESETLAQSLLDLNNRINVAYRELARIQPKT